MSRTVRNLLNITIGQIGYMEKESCANLDDKTANAGDNNHTMYARDLHKAGYYQADKCGYAWCDVFVDWVFYILCNRNAVIAQKMTFQSGPYGAGCEWSAKYYKNAGRYYTSNPQPGDQIFFGRNGKYEHTGIVETVSATTITTIEGNTSNMVARRTYSINSSYIMGYGRPDFDDDNDELVEEDKPVEVKPANPDTDSENHTTYKVKSGDSWWKIAQNELGDGAKMYELAMFNGASIKDTLYVGNVLLIPTEGDMNANNNQEETTVTTPVTKPTTSNTEVGNGEYKVKAGDSWWKIAEKEMGNGTKMNELAAYNGMKTTTIIHPGDILKIPGKGSNGNTTTTERTYKVKSGDSWWGIAEKELGSWKHMDKLAKYNGMKTTTIIHPGDILKLPKV